MKFLIVLFIALIANLQAAPKVAVSIGPVHSLVSDLMKGVATPDLLMPSNASHHDYSPAPKTLMTVQQADLVVWVSRDLEFFLPKILGKFQTRNIEFGTLAHIKKIAPPHGHGCHKHGEYDPHLWLDVENCLILVAEVANELIAIDPEHTALYEKNKSAVMAKLQALQAQMQLKLTKLQKRPFIVYHDGFQYIVTKFKLNQVGVLKNHPEHPLSISQYEKIYNLIKIQGVKTLFVEPQYNDSINLKMAQASGVKLVPLDSMGQGDYVQTMQNIIKSFELGLSN